jgi:Spy/CpxP family protein refolding chaperone
MSIQNIRRSVLIVAGAAALAAAGLLAGRLAAGVLPGAGPWGPGSKNVFTRIAGTLELSDDQTSRVKAVLKTHADEIEAQLQAAAQARRALQDAMHARPIDETAIRDRARDLGRVHGDGGVLFARVRSEIEPILSADQLGRLEKLREKMRHRGDRIATSFHEFVESETP